MCELYWKYFRLGFFGCFGLGGFGTFRFLGRFFVFFRFWQFQFGTSSSIWVRRPSLCKTEVSKQTIRSATNGRGQTANNRRATASQQTTTSLHIFSHISLHIFYASLSTSHISPHTYIHTMTRDTYRDAWEIRQRCVGGDVERCVKMCARCLWV